MTTARFRATIVLPTAAALLLGATPPVAAATVTDPGQGAVPLDPGVTGASELGGLTWAGADTWLAVSDDVSEGPRAFVATIAVDGADGTVTGPATVDSVLGLAAGGDPEGLALEPGGATIIVADEVGPALRRCDAVTGAVLATASVPQVFTAGLRTNYGFESAAVDPHGRVWTANEEALTSDGDLAGFAAGTIVRLQRFAPDLMPDGQWGYVTDPVSGDVLGSDPGRDVEKSGVSELAVLDDGTLVVLERMLGAGPPPGFPVLRIRLYALDLSLADDTGSMPNLAPGGFVPAAKTLLWEHTFNALSEPYNLEGMALGPAVAGGGRSLLLVADDAGLGSPVQAVYPLVVTVPPLFEDGFESGALGAWSGTSP